MVSSSLGSLALLLAAGGAGTALWVAGQPNHWPRPRQPPPYDADDDPWNRPGDAPLPTQEPQAYVPPGSQALPLAPAQDQAGMQGEPTVQDIAQLEAQLRRDELMYQEVGQSLRNRQEMLDRHRATRMGVPGAEAAQDRRGAFSPRPARPGPSAPALPRRAHQPPPAQSPPRKREARDLQQTPHWTLSRIRRKPPPVCRTPTTWPPPQTYLGGTPA